MIGSVVIGMTTPGTVPGMGYQKTSMVANLLRSQMIGSAKPSGGCVLHSIQPSWLGRSLVGIFPLAGIVLVV